MSGLLSSIESGFSNTIGNAVSGVEKSVGNAVSGLTGQISSFFGGTSQGSVVPTTSVATLPDIYTTDNYGNFNSNYAIQLLGQDETETPLDIFASLPEHFSFHLSADWQPLLNNPSLSGLLGGAFKEIGAAAAIGKQGLGVADYTASSTMQVWNSTSPLDLSFPFVFNAITNSQTEVMDQIQSLCSLISPSTVDGGFIRVPGPIIYNLVLHPERGYKVSLRIGNALFFPNVIVTGVSPMFDVMCDASGNFISAQVDVAMRTSQILTKDDIKGIFNPSINSATSNVGSGLAQQGI
jgi:hypothetical protein